MEKHKTVRYFIYLLQGLLLAGAVLLAGGCSGPADIYPRNLSHAPVTLESIRKGDQLVHRYCQSCHALPDPSLLDAGTWEKGVLPNMGPRLGIFEYGYRDYPSYRSERDLPPGFYPSKPMMSNEEWQHILDYYTATAPDTLPRQNRPEKIKMGLALFSVQEPPSWPSAPAVSLVRIDTVKGKASLVVGDAVSQSLFRYDDQFRAIDSLKGAGAIVDMEQQDSSLFLCDIGVLNPNNGRFGKVRRLQADNLGHWRPDKVLLFSGLSRPVEVIPADLNGDGRQDYLVCEFGFLTGALSWMEGGPGGQFVRQVIKPVPGAIKAYIDDYNKDGKPDLWVLFAQGDEGISLFTNKGKGQFEERRLLTFPPVYGSSYFELADFNQDGHPDILYTCGDNADYSPILKPYHGIYIYMNDGHNRFEKTWFFPINGCYKAMARDFDGDGDLDIAAISFFPDFQRQPEEGFVYLENRGHFRFLPFSLPQMQKGRWLTMDVGDGNGDGKPDILLGNFSLGPSMMPSRMDWKKGPPFIWLVNQGGIQKRKP